VFTANAEAQAFWRSAGYARDDVLSFGKLLRTDQE